MRFSKYHLFRRLAQSFCLRCTQKTTTAKLPGREVAAVSPYTYVRTFSCALRPLRDLESLAGLLQPPLMAFRHAGH